SQAVVAVSAGVLFMVAPPRKSLGLFSNLVFVALFLTALSGFLPVRWFPPLDWWIELSKLGGSLPKTRSPQPWLTLQWACLLLLALAWGYYLAAFEWTRRLREKTCAGFGIAMLV